jgi:Uma2 family endonuclease
VAACRVAKRTAAGFNRFAMSALPKRFFTPEEYLELEAKAEYKSQYFAGEIFAMAGAQPAHDKITGNLIIALGLRFRGRSGDVFTSDMRVRAADDMYTYPDVTALCGEPLFATRGNQPPRLVNPGVIFEVLSPSTEAFDRGIKFARYRRLETLRDYVLVTADRMRVEHHYLRDDGVWAYADYGEPDWGLRLESVGCELPLAEVYERVTFPASGPGGR